MEISNIEFMILIFGNIWAGFLFILFILIALKTPALIFFKAMIKRKPVGFVKFKTGIGEFMVSKHEEAGSMDLQGLGYVQLTEGSQIREKNSGVPVYNLIGEYGVTIRDEYPAIIQELREFGYKITKYEDYMHCLLLANNEKYALDWKDQFKDDAKMTAWAEKEIEKLQALELEVKPYKTYKFHDLENMFPNNINPVHMDTKVQAEVNRALRKNKMDVQTLVYAALAIFIVLMGVVIFLKVYKGESPQVIIKTVETGAKVAQNLTMG